MENAADKIAVPPRSASVLPENDLHPDPATIAYAVRLLEIRVQELEQLTLLLSQRLLEIMLRR
jgi:hypothetical protein